MAFNKTKAMESALKALNQGKVAQAIQEYQQILRNDSKDQVVLMTVGDLFARQGNMQQAVEYFERLAELYLHDGFNSKAIAIYKKISKLVPAETQSLERLANLYVQQGILSEARPVFLQLAELHLKANQSAKAVEVLRRLLEVEPDNPRVQRRLAELYLAMGQKKEAALTYLSFARQLSESGEGAEALKMADAALAAEPSSAPAILLKARLLGVTGHADAAIEALLSLPDAETGAESLPLLVDLYLKAGNTNRALELAQTAVASGPEKHPLVYRVATSLVETGEADKALDLIGRIREAALNAGEQERLARVLTSIAERLKGRIEPLEWLVDLYRKTSDSFHLPDALSQLGEALSAAGQFEQAEIILGELLEREPDNELVRQRLNQVRTKLGRAPEAPASLTPSEPLGLLVNGTAPAGEKPPAGEPALDEETQRYVSQALTDVDLFSSYGLAQKAVQLLDSILQRAPRYPPALERLLDLAVGSGNDRQTAELAAQLEQIYLQRGDSTNAERFAELRRRFHRAFGLSEEPLAAAANTPAAPLEEFRIPPAETEAPVATEEAAVPASAGTPGHEIDLSEEWAAMTQEPAAAPLAEEAVPAARESASAETADFELELISSAPEGEERATTSSQFLDQLVAEVEGLEAPVASSNELAAAETELAARPEAEPAAAPAGGADTNQLSEVFQEFRAELGELGEQEEDLETHYNLGIAYREMGLLDEAIGEFQKVAKAVQGGRPFRYAMQCLTLLGLVFMDKKESKIAAMWYERALETPGLDPETILALRYDLGVAQAAAGDAEAALESFRQVYARNIDYRDVAERIAALQKS